MSELSDIAKIVFGASANKNNLHDHKSHPKLAADAIRIYLNLDRVGGKDGRRLLLCVSRRCVVCLSCSRVKSTNMLLLKLY